jgi:hypothetical protein
MVNFRGRVTKNFVKIPSKLIGEEGLQNGDIVDVSLEKIEQ